MKTPHLLLACILLFPGSALFGQVFPGLTHKKALDFQSRVLLVVLDEDHSGKKLQKNPARLKYFRDQIDGRNQALRQAVAAHWTFNQEIEFLPASEADAKCKKDKKKYCRVQYPYYHTYSSQEDQPKGGWHKDGDSLKYDTSIRYTDHANSQNAIHFALDNELWQVSVPNDAVSRGDVTYAVQQMQRVLQFVAEGEDRKGSEFYAYEYRRNQHILPKKTLLIDKREVDPTLSETIVGKLYPFRVKLVDYREIEQAILGQDPDVAVLQILTLPTHPIQNGYLYANAIVITTAKDGKVCLLDLPGVDPKKLVKEDKNFTFVWSPRVKKSIIERISAHFPGTAMK